MIMDIMVRSSIVRKLLLNEMGHKCSERLCLPSAVYCQARNYVLSSVVTSVVLMTFLFLQISGQAETILNQ